MTHQQHAREAENILALADESSTAELLTAICHTLMGLYWQREAEKGRLAEAVEGMR